MFGPLRYILLSCSCLLLLVACPSDDGVSESESETGVGTETTSATETGDGCSPAGVYGDCAGGTQACMAEGGPDQCILDNTTIPTIAVCGRPCTDVCECWAAPSSGEAPVTCESLAPGDDGTCILDCSGGQACPDGMLCNLLPTGTELCVFSQ